MLSELEARFSGNDQELLSALGDACVTGRRLVEKASPAPLNFRKSTGRFCGPSRKCTRAFVAGSTPSQQQQQQQQQQPLFALYIYTLILLNREKK